MRAAEGVSAGKRNCRRLGPWILVLAPLHGCWLHEDVGEEQASVRGEIMSLGIPLGEYFKKHGVYPVRIEDAMTHGHRMSGIQWPDRNYWGFPYRYVRTSTEPDSCIVFSLGADDRIGGTSRDEDWAVLRSGNDIEFLDEIPRAYWE